MGREVRRVAPNWQHPKEWRPSARRHHPIHEGMRMNMPTENQQAVLTLLSEHDPHRHLYLGRDGLYWVTYSGGLGYSPLQRAEVEQLLADGWIVESRQDFFELAPKFITQATQGGAP